MADSYVALDRDWSCYILLFHSSQKSRLQRQDKWNPLWRKAFRCHKFRRQCFYHDTDHCLTKAQISPWKLTKISWWSRYFIVFNAAVLCVVAAAYWGRLPFVSFGWPEQPDRKENSNINHNHYNFLNFDWCINCFIFHQLLCRVVIRQCNRTVGCNRTPVIAEFITITIAKMHEFVTLHSVSASDIFPNFGWLVLKALSQKKKKKRMHLFSGKLKRLWSVGNRTSCRPIRSVIIPVIKQIGLSRFC